MAKRYYNLEKETKEYLKACEAKNVAPFRAIKDINDIVITQKAFNKDISFIKDLNLDGCVLWLDAGIVSSYPGTGTTWFDLTQNRNNGTLTNGPTFDQVHGGRIILNRLNGHYISTTYNLTPTYTVEVMMINTNFNPWAVMFGNDFWNSSLGDVGFFRTSTDIDFGRANTTRITTTSNTINQIARYTFVREGTTGQIYNNGRLLTQQTVSAFASSNTGTYFGARHQNTGILATDYWSGSIFNVMVYNRSLSPAEIQQNYNALKGRFGL